MPDPKRLLRTLKLAVDSFHNTPDRHGRIVRVQNGSEMLVAGDLHGNIENFRLLLEKAQLGKHPQRHLVLQELIHGPFRYPSGGDKSHQLLDLLAALKCQFPRQVHLLLGNHELAQWTGQAIAKRESELNALFREGLDTAYAAHAAEVYAAYLQLFAVVPLAVRTPNRIFLSHSLPRAARLEQFDAAILERETHQEQDLRPGGAIHALLWGRDTGLATVQRFLLKVDADLLITGHIPCERGYDVPNERQLILDCMGARASYCLFPLDRPLAHKELIGCIGSL
jgi:hypothetical protein